MKNIIRMKKSFIHAGLFHSNNILHYLIGVYKFKIIYKQGTISFPPPNRNTNACILMPNDDTIGINNI